MKNNFQPKKCTSRIFLICAGMLFFGAIQLQGQDTDGDGILDINDLDDDNDGILDADECFIAVLSSTPTPDGIEDNNFPIGYWDAEYYRGHFGILGSTYQNSATDSDETGGNGTPTYLGEAYFQVNSLTLSESGSFTQTESPTSVSKAPPGYVGTNWDPVNPNNYWSIHFNRKADNNGTLDFGGSAYDGDDIMEVLINGVQQDFYGNCCSATFVGSNTFSIPFNRGDSIEIRMTNLGWIGSFNFNFVINYDCEVNKDSDGDGLPDGLDLDSDNDGIPDITEAGGTDANGDGEVDYPTIGDPMSMTDADNDGLEDSIDDQDSGSGAGEVTSGTALPVTNTDGVGPADHVDLDSDDDGIPDIIEADGVDANGDGQVDYATPGDPMTMVDLDGDGLSDTYDINDQGVNSPGWTAGTTIPNTNTDGDLLPNYKDLDSDNDGISDVVENGGGDTDVDNGGTGDLDGFIDNYSDDLDDNGWNDSSTTTLLDTDGDNVPDYLDIDSDNDGILDYKEGLCSTCPAFSQDPTINTTDSDSDGVLDIFENLTSSNGTSGSNTGISPNLDDTSGNGTPDYLDTNADGDVAFDWTEGFDSNNDGKAVDDLLIIANTFETAGTPAKDYYDNALDTDSDGLPDWLDNLPTIVGYDNTVRPPFLDVASPFWHDDDTDGLVDLFDVTQDGTTAPLPNNNSVGDLDWRDDASASILPVELTAFYATTDECTVTINWQSTNHDNFKYFELQKSLDGINFKLKNIVVESNRNINTGSYQEIDEEINGLNYYRLKIVDYDGSFKYSETISAKTDCRTGSTMSLHPNPIMANNAPLSVVFTNGQKEEIFYISDATGSVIRTINHQAFVGRKNELDVDISDLTPGLYIITRLVNNIWHSERFVLQN